MVASCGSIGAAFDCIWAGSSVHRAAYGCIETTFGCIGTAFGCIGIAFGCIGTAFGCIGAAFGYIGIAFGCIGIAFGCISSILQYMLHIAGWLAGHMNPKG